MRSRGGYTTVSLRDSMSPYANQHNIHVMWFKTNNIINKRIKNYQILVYFSTGKLCDQLPNIAISREQVEKQNICAQWLKDQMCVT